MPRKSSIDQRSPGARAHILKRLRENRLTLDELLADLRDHFPNEAPPSRSALGRFAKSYDEMMRHEREIATAAEAMVAELGEDYDNKSGALLAQAVTTLASQAALGAIETGEASIKDVLNLARAAKSAQETRTLSLKERQAVEKAARERLLAEQQEKLAQLEKAGGGRRFDAETLRVIREEIYGIAG